MAVRAEQRMLPPLSARPQVPPAFTLGPVNGSQWAAWWANSTTTFCALATKDMVLITPGKTTTHYLPCREGGECGIVRFGLW